MFSVCPPPRSTFCPFLPHSVPQKTNIFGNHQQAPYPLTSSWASTGTWVGGERLRWSDSQLPPGWVTACWVWPLQKVTVPVLSIQLFPLYSGNCSLPSPLGPRMRTVRAPNHPCHFPPSQPVCK